MQRIHWMNYLNQKFWLHTKLLLVYAFFSIGIAYSTVYASQDLEIALEAMPKTLDPRFAVDANGMRITQQLLYETLVQQDYNLEVIPFLAEKWETPSPTTYIFQLRKDARFSNGDPVTAQDVQYTFESILDPETGSPFKGIGSGIKTITVTDEQTIRFDLVAPKASFLLDLFIPIFQKPEANQNAETLIGTGPFILESQSAAEFTLSRNPNYYGEQPHLEKIIFKIVKDDNTRFLKLKKGDIDFVLNAIPLDKLKQFQKSPLKRTYKLLEGPALNYQYIGFNYEHPILKNKSVRQAIAYALNRDELIEFYKKNHATKADSLLIPENTFYAKDLLVYDYNIEKAEQLLDDAGYTKKDDERFTLSYKTSTSKSAVTQARIVKSQLKKIGITVNVQSFEWGTFFSDVKSGNFEIFSLRWVGVSEPDFYYDLFHSTQFPPNGRNRVRYTNLDLDTLLETGRVETDLETRRSIYQKVQEILAEEMPYVSLWHNNNIVVMKQDIEGYQLHPTGGFHSFKNVRRTN